MENDPELAKTLMALQTLQVSGQVSYPTQYDMVRAFHVGARGKGLCFIGDMSTMVPAEVMEGRARLINEEVNEELMPLLKKMAVNGTYSLEQQAELLDHIADSVYVLLGLAVCFGLPYDTAFMMVSEANMRKVVRPGGPKFREDGKVIKPEGWKDPGTALFNLVLSAYTEANKERLQKMGKAQMRAEEAVNDESTPKTVQ